LIRIEKLILGEKFRMGGLGGSGRGGDGEAGVHIQGDGREANFLAAGLITELEWDMLLAEWRGGERCERETENHGALVDVEGLLRKGERAEFSFGIRDLAHFESRGDVGLQIGGDEIVLRLFAGVDVKAGANFEDDGELKRASAGHGFERYIGAGGDDVAAGRHLGLRRGWISSG
jgi:hypothetical protein